MRWKRWLVVVGVLSVFVVANAVFSERPSASTLVAVLPFEHAPGTEAEFLSADECEILMSEALARWRGVALASALSVADGLARLGGQPRPDDYRRLGAAIGAGRFVRGDVSPQHDSLRVHAALYDAANPARPLREHTVVLAKGLDGVGARFGELADSLLLRDTRLTPEARGALSGTNSLEAFRAFQRGLSALSDWDLPAAGRWFQNAVAMDPDFPQATYWRAEVALLTGSGPDELRELAGQAFRLRQGLTPRDRRAAEAIQALADGSFPHACRLYRGLTESDSLDFIAWYGLGTCQARDPVAIRDPASRSGWSFRGSAQAAQNAYRTALSRVPSSHRAFRGNAFGRLTRILYADPSRTKTGYGLAGPDTLRFAASPGIHGDTLTLVPFPFIEVMQGARRTMDTTQSAAWARNRRMLDDVTAEWVRAFPGSADALESRARALELEDVARESPGDSSAALEPSRRARRASTDAVQRSRLASLEVRVLLRHRRFAAAAAAADSALALATALTAPQAAELAWMAVLTGRAAQAVALAVQAAPIYDPSGSQGLSAPLPQRVKEIGLRLLIHAGLGTAADSVRRLMRETDRAIGTWVEPRSQEVARSALLDFPSALAFAEAGPTPRHRRDAQAIEVIGAQWATARGDHAAPMRLAASLEARFGQRLVGGVDFALELGSLLLAVGDTAHAIVQLDRAVGAIPTLPSIIMSGEMQPSIPLAASLPRLLALRAGDRATARRLAGAAAALWSHADPILQPQVRRMAALAAPGG